MSRNLVSQPGCASLFFCPSCLAIYSARPIRCTGFRYLDQLSAMDIINVAETRISWHQGMISNALHIFQNALFLIGDRQPADVFAIAEPPPPPASCQRVASTLVHFRLLRNSLRITSSVKVSMPQSVWCMTNYSYVPSCL